MDAVASVNQCSEGATSLDTCAGRKVCDQDSSELQNPNDDTMDTQLAAQSAGETRCRRSPSSPLASLCRKQSRQSRWTNQFVSCPLLVLRHRVRVYQKTRRLNQLSRSHRWHVCKHNLGSSLVASGHAPISKISRREDVQIDGRDNFLCSVRTSTLSWAVHDSSQNDELIVGLTVRGFL